MATRTHETSMGVREAECNGFDVERAKRDKGRLIWDAPSNPMEVKALHDECGNMETRLAPSGRRVYACRKGSSLHWIAEHELRNLPTPEERLRQAGIHIVLWADDIYFPIIDGHGLLVLGRDTPKDLQGGIDGAGGWKSYDRAVTAALEWLDKQEGNQ